MNITIMPGAAIEDAQKIDDIIEKIKDDMNVLDQAIRSTIPDGIQTTWAESLRSNWENYYNEEIPNALEDMKLSAENLKIAVEKALKYDQGIKE